jgi:Arc/MetJ family transcription regulator
MSSRKKPRTTKRVRGRVREPATKTPYLPGTRTASREGKVRKEFWLDPALLREAQAYLGTATERETVELALDLVAFRKELSQGARALRGLSLSRID